jgi:hypothetical protein
VVLVGRSEPKQSRPHIGALLLSYYADDGALHYAGRGRTMAELKRLAGVLTPLEMPRMALAKVPPRDSLKGRPHCPRAVSGATGPVKA